MNSIARLRQELHDDAGDGVSRYTKIAMLLRHKIANGEWTVGTQLPTIDELMQQYGAARVTVRQAVAILAGEGLLVSQRGKGTFVMAAPPGPDKDLKRAINDPLLSSSDLSIEVLEKGSVKVLPADLKLDAKAAKPYVVVKKIHRLRGEVFAYMEMYLAQEIFADFPPGGERAMKISRMLTEAGWDKRMDFIRQSITISPADYEIAKKLDYVFAAPVAKIKRWTFDRKHRVVMAGTYWYRGDRFVLEFDLPIDQYMRHPSMVFPEPQDK